MKNFFIALLFITTSITAFSQNSKNWVISYGLGSFNNLNNNIIGKNYLKYNTVSYPNSLSVEKNMYKNFSLKFNGYINQFENQTNQVTTAKNKTDLFLAVDVNLKYDLSEGFGKNNWLNPFVTGGFGYSKFDIVGDAKLNVGVGSNFWINKNFGIQLNSTYNKNIQLKDSDYFTYHVGMVVKFDKKFSKVLLVDKENKTEIDSARIVEVEKKVIIKDKTNKKSEKKSENENLVKVKEITEVTKIEGDNKVVTEKIEEKIVPKNDVITLETKPEIVKEEKIIDNKQVEVKPEINAVENVEIKKTILVENFDKVENAKNETVSIVDTDGDKVPDEFDKCPLVFGTVSNKGCPEKNIENKSTTSFVQHEVEAVIENKPIENSEYDAKSILKVTNVYFENDDFTISDNEKSKIHMIIYIMDKNPKSRIVIEGHTAKDGDVDYSKKLSENRANAVKQYFIKRGVDGKRIDIKSIGNAQPVSNENNDKAKGLNRRAKIILLN